MSPLYFQNKIAIIPFVCFMLGAFTVRAGSLYSKKDSPGVVARIHAVVLNHQPLSDTRDSLGFLRKYKGKYPYQVKLLDNPALKKRLVKLLGNRFAFMKKTWAVETPMEIQGDQFNAYACQAHNCVSTNFMIVVDLKKNILYAGIREEGRVTLYAEDGSSNETMNKWANNQ